MSLIVLDKIVAQGESGTFVLRIDDDRTLRIHALDRGDGSCDVAVERPTSSKLTACPACVEDAS